MKVRNIVYSALGNPFVMYVRNIADCVLCPPLPSIQYLTNRDLVNSRTVCVSTMGEVRSTTYFKCNFLWFLKRMEFLETLVKFELKSSRSYGRETKSLETHFF